MVSKTCRSNCFPRPPLRDPRSCACAFARTRRTCTQVARRARSRSSVISRYATRVLSSCPRRGRRSAGFATATVLGIAAVVGLLSVGALHDALFGELLAGSRQLHQRAAVLAELGLHQGMARLQLSPPQPGGEQAFSLQPIADSTDSVVVSIRHVGSSALPAGHSLGRLSAHQFQIESTGHVARGIRMTQVQGATRVMPAQ